MEKLMKLNFMVDEELYQTVSVEKGETVMAIDAPEKEGYHFVRWDDLPETGMAGKELSVSAVYEKNEYSVVFLLDGEIVQEQTLPYGADIKAPEIQDTEEKAFYGWGDIPKMVPARDLKIEGITEPPTYSFTMLVDDEVFAAYRFPSGADLTDLPVPERIGHDFSGWNKNYKVMPHSNLTVKGKFKPHRHTLSFIIEGEMEFTKKMDFGAPIRAYGIPNRLGYTFSGWEDVPSTMPDSDLIFKGKFEINSHALRFMLEDQLIYQSTLEFGSVIKAPEVPAKEGYMFSGWRGLPKTMPDDDFTAEGRYYLRKYKLVYIVDGKEYAKDTVPYGAPVEAIDAPEKEGFRFSGWSEVPLTMPAEDVTVNGSFSEL